MSRRLLPLLSAAALIALAPRIAHAQDEGDGNDLDNLGEEDAAEEGEEGDEADEADEDDAPAPVQATADESDAADEAPAGPPKDRPPWKLGRPGIDPAVGAVLFPTGDGGMTGLVALGAQASLPFGQETQETVKWGGSVRAVGQVLVGPDLYNGYAARLGAFVGPSAGPARLRVGPDFFINQYVLAGLDTDPFSGIGLPLTLSLSGKGAGIYGGVEPAWYTSGGWPAVDWSNEDIFGFGDEFAYKVGGNISTSSFGLGLGYTHRITSFGVQRGVSVGIGF
jgi:hypothetical protein